MKFRFLLLTAFVLVVAAGCHSKQATDENNAAINERIMQTAPPFTSSLDSMDWVLKNCKLSVTEQLTLCKFLSWNTGDDFEKARNYALEGIALAEKENEQHHLARLHRVLGVVYQNYGVNDSSLFYLNIALSEAKKIEDRELEALLLLNIGNLSSGEASISYYLESLSYFESENNSDPAVVQEMLVAIHGNIGSQYSQIGNFLQAQKHYLKMMQMAEEFGHIRGMLQAYINGILLYTESDPELALDYAMRAQKIIDENEELIQALPYIYSNLSRLYSKGFKDYRMALEYGKKNLLTAENLGQRGKIKSMAYSYMADAYLNLKEYALAETNALKSIAEDSTSSSTGERFLIAAKANIMLGNRDKALLFIDEYHHFDSKFLNEDFQDRLSEVEIKYETDKKDFEIERQQTVIEKQNLQRWLLMGGIGACVLILVIFWYMLRLRARRNHALAELNTTKDKFFSIISHDLKNPAIAQRDAIRMLFSKAAQWDTATLQSFSGELLHSADMQVELLYNLLGWAQLHSGRMIYQPETFDLAQRIVPELALIKKIADAKGVQFETEIPQTCIITADAEMMATVIRNLLSNAVKFTPEGGMVKLGVACNAPTHTISITDTGTGIPPEALQNIFRLDTRHSRPGTAGETGTGLGLIVCNELLEKHNTILNIESEEGKGSRFWFEI